MVYYIGARSPTSLVQPGKEYLPRIKKTLKKIKRLILKLVCDKKDTARRQRQRVYEDTRMWVKSRLW